MKLKHVGMIVVSVLAMSSAAVSAAEGDESVTTTVNGGVIHFKGEVVNAACAIDSESMNQTVELGQVRSSRLAKAGDLSSAVGFNIKLNDCDTNVSSNAAVAFLGTTVTSNDSTDLLVSLGIKKIALLDNKEHSAEKHVPDNSACTPLQDRLADASTEFDVGQQHLSLSVPQIYVGRMARGYVSPDLWEEGINAGLLNYSFNGNSINNRSNHNAGKSNYAYLNLQSGINIGSWRLRDNSTWSYYSGSSNSSDSNIARATFNAQIGGKVLMTLKYGNKSVPFGAIVTHGENKNGSIVAENGQVYLTGLPQSGKLQVSWGKDKNSNCIVEYKLPEVSPGTLLNQQTAICR